MNKIKKIKEDRATVSTQTKGRFSFPTKTKGIDYDKRFASFWEEIEGIRINLNNSQRGKIITDSSSPMITNYLLWRILFEIKLLNKEK